MSCGMGLGALCLGTCALTGKAGPFFLRGTGIAVLYRDHGFSQLLYDHVSVCFTVLSWVFVLSKAEPQY